MRTPVLLPLAALVLVVLAACGTSGATTSPGADRASVADLELEVTVDVFSGVPNPTWIVRGPEAATVAELINGLPEQGSVDAAAGLDLGFRGFVLRGLELPGGADQARVRGSDVVLSHGTDHGRIYTDVDRTLYTMLRTMSEAHLDSNVLQAIPIDGLKGS